MPINSKTNALPHGLSFSYSPFLVYLLIFCMWRFLANIPRKHPRTRSHKEHTRARNTLPIEFQHFLTYYVPRVLHSVEVGNLGHILLSLRMVTPRLSRTIYDADRVFIKTPGKHLHDALPLPFSFYTSPRCLVFGTHDEDDRLDLYETPLFRGPSSFILAHAT